MGDQALTEKDDFDDIDFLPSDIGRLEVNFESEVEEGSKDEGHCGTTTTICRRNE